MKNIIMIMTTQIVSLLKEKAITATESAVTVDRTKAWKGIKKTFTLCDNPPMNIMVNGSPTINNFPITILINEFRKIVKSDNIQDIADEFLSYIGKTVPLTNVESFMKSKIEKFKELYGNLSAEDYTEFFEEISKIDIEIPSFIGDNYDAEFDSMIPKDLTKKQKDIIKTSLKKLFCHYLITLSTGIIITGISSNDYFPSYISFNIILNDNHKMEVINEKSEINCNHNKFEIFGQNDVINAYLTGIDEEFEEEIYNLIKIIINPSKRQLKRLKSEIQQIKQMNKKLMLKNIDSMPPDDLNELLKTLIKSTEIKRKLISSIDSVGGDVNITKIIKD